MIGEEDYLESITKQSPFFVDHASMLPSMKRDHWIAESVVPELLRTLVFARPCGGDQFAAGTVSPSLDMSR